MPNHDPEFPREERDHDHQAELYYNEPMRSKAKLLERENMELKRLLRENNIAWPSLKKYGIQAHRAQIPEVGPFGSAKASSSARRTRASTAAQARKDLPHLPTEIQLRIFEYALTSKEPILDPLSKIRPGNITQHEKTRGNQIAIHVLATCHAFRVEGTRYLWNNNTFTFTTVQALRAFSLIDASLRRKVKHVNLRIIAQYYDDETRRHTLDCSYHFSLKKDLKLPVQRRAKANELARTGFHSYSWNQIIDFLHVLLPPWTPDHDNKQVRPRLLPNLETMRVDMVNFPDYFLSVPDVYLHELGAHQLGCTLNELTVTGMPNDENGEKVSDCFQGMLRDNGLYLEAAPAYVQVKSGLRPLVGGKGLYQKVVRSWRRMPASTAAEGSSSLFTNSHNTSLELPAAPEEVGYPSPSREGNRTIWKRVPVSRDAREREWMEFDRRTGYPMRDSDPYDSDDDEEFVCSECGEVHAF